MNNGADEQDMTIESNAMTVGAGPCNLAKAVEPELLVVTACPLMHQRSGADVSHAEDIKAA